MKIIIAGSRHLKIKPQKLHSMISTYEIGITEIVSGRASGIDRCGEDYADKMSIPKKLFPAKWGKHGIRAGHIRNEEMAKYAEGLILIWDGKSTGSLNMLKTAEKYNLQVWDWLVN